MPPITGSLMREKNAPWLTNIMVLQKLLDTDAAIITTKYRKLTFGVGFFGNVYTMAANKKQQRRRRKEEEEEEKGRRDGNRTFVQRTSNHGERGGGNGGKKEKEKWRRGRSSWPSTNG